MSTTPRAAGTVYYPEEDGKVSESTKHYKQGADLFAALRTFFAPRFDVFVGGNLFVYYREGEPKKCFSPDIMVAFGVRPRPDEERGSYRMWEEGVAPAVVIELTSTSTRQDDTIRKPRLYATLGVREYYLFDPLGEFLLPRLQGNYLNDQGGYEHRAGDDLASPALGLRLVVRDGWLRLLNPTTGALLPTLAEAEAALLATEAAREQERAARLAAEVAHAQEHAARLDAEAEIARLRAELARQQEAQ
jgi:Uma2 family endonuclease